jgi:hypothetical protein
MRSSTAPCSTRVPSTTPICPLAPAQATFLTGCGIDISDLPSFEQSSTLIKLSRLMELSEENAQLEVSVQQRSLQTDPPVPSGVPFFLKLIDGSNDVIHIMRVTTDQSAEELRRIIADRIGRPAELVIVSEDDDMRAFDTETLLAGQRSVLSRASLAVAMAAI